MEDSSRYLTRKKSPKKQNSGIWMPVQCKDTEYNFKPYSPHLGCYEIICLKCGLHKPNHTPFQPEIHSFKGKRFAFGPKTKFRPPQHYSC